MVKNGEDFYGELGSICGRIGEFRHLYTLAPPIFNTAWSVSGGRVARQVFAAGSCDYSSYLHAIFAAGAAPLLKIHPVY